MKVFHSIDNLSRFTRPAVTVGSFDGVHGGHRVLLERIGRIADETAGESVVVTFSPHPRQVLSHGGEVKLLNTVPEKIYLLDDAGVDNLVIVPFDAAFARTSYSDFVSRVLVGKIGMQSLVVGYDHRFGHEKEGGYASLIDMSERLGFTVEQIPRQLAGEHNVSSTDVRNAIMAGDMALAAELLSASYVMMSDIYSDGTVAVRDEVKLIPPPGRYAVGVGDAYRDTLTITSTGAMHLEGQQGLEPQNDVLITFRKQL